MGSAKHHQQAATWLQDAIPHALARLGFREYVVALHGWHVRFCPPMALAAAWAYGLPIFYVVSGALPLPPCPTCCPNPATQHTMPLMPVGRPYAPSPSSRTNRSTSAPCAPLVHLLSPHSFKSLAVSLFFFLGHGAV